MWRNKLIFLYVIFGTAAFFDYGRYFGAEARFFSEGGNFNLPSQQQQQLPAYKQPAELEQFQQQQPFDYDNEAKLAQIIEELYARQYEEQQAKAAQEYEQAAAQQSFIQQQQQQPSYDGEPRDEALEQLELLSNEVKQISETQDQPQVPVAKIPAKGEQEAASLPLQAKSEQPLTPQKKGQSEFVEFIEPPPSKVMKSVETMDKRVVVDRASSSSGFNGVKILSSTGNIMFIAVLTVCSVFMVAGVVGGVYYYNNVRKQPENDFDDFTRYSPAGPGKKLQGFRNGIRMDENGDDSLAYKAQLHHYQQTKQKIIGAEEGLSPSTTPTGVMSSPRSIHHNENSEDEAEDLEEHNYSVYECPGLAPTGDIEVSNPNFGHH